ncbi:DNA cytosine methyltransferase [Rhodohalobacter mucosus]|uniref:DNA (cytosine-5-)-methyltransferase n=1 Tax=Rhodohalobacter mucosus TaxID=2079485 RepID=A0A316TP67_9BACT|nr:DNA cytosine methyltransferase [Rhodohalobacter mucosus]PWN05451.1 DNA (cytosine-5-)-methyltransferase [Rhodohalobacter mucosus]
MKAVDFFCGAGGVTCGFRQANVDVLGGIDVDDVYKDTYERNNPGSKFIHKDISKLSYEELQEQIAIEKDDDNLIFIGCSPCQYYTNLKTDKTKSKNSRLLLKDFQKFVDYFNPGYIFIENVPGFDKSKDSPIAKFKDFLSIKNFVFDDKVINAKYFGVPQNRRRYVLIATRIQTQISIPEGDKKNLKTVEDAIGNYDEFPPVEAGHIDKTVFMHTVAGLTDINLKRIKKVSKDGGNRLDFSDDVNLQLDCYKNHSGHTDVYGRMSWDKPAPAITTKFRYTSSGRYGHPEQDRAISIREGATLQSFPKGYVFYANSLSAIGKMIGNAVPPKLAEEVATVITD